MIPKIIHYVWLGGKEIPENLRNYMESWRQMMPAWEVRGWTEANIPAEVLAVPYVRQALEARKFAFASDYIRLWALEQFGGVYMDTDVEVIRPFDQLPEYNTDLSTNHLALSTNHSSLSTTQRVTAFIGFEECQAHLPATCVMGCEPHCQWVRDMLATYDNASFLHTGTDPLCKFDLTTNVQRMGKAMMEKYGLIPNGQEQFLTKQSLSTNHSALNTENEVLRVYDHHHFSPITSTRVMRKTEKTFCVHHFASSWRDQKGWACVRDYIYDNILGRELVDKLVNVKRRIKHRL